MSNKVFQKHAVKELFQTVIIPLIVGVFFIVWIALLILSKNDKMSAFPLSILLFFVMYFVSGPIFAGVLLGFMSMASFMIIVISVIPATREIMLFQTVWLWTMFGVFEIYKIFRDRRNNRTTVEQEILNTDMDILRNKIQDENDHCGNLKQRLLNYKYLSEMTVPLSSTMSEERIVEQIIELASKFLGRGSWTITRSSENDMFAEYVSTYKVALLIQDLMSDNRFVIKNPHFRSLMAVPLEVNGEYSGILKGTSEKEETFDEGDLRFLSILGGISSLALTNAQLYKRTQDLAITDTLTGLYVQSYFKERLMQEIVRSKRYNLPLSIALIDIDYFKLINDNYGHSVGDEVLKHMVAVMKKRLRDTDFLSRYGGEEFAIIMLQTGIKEAHKVVEDIRKSLEKEKFKADLNGKEISLELTVSAGLSALNESVNSENDFILLADNALYLAKNNGRNRIEISEKEK